MLVSQQHPHWLQVLLKEKFFNACIIHEYAKKNEKNIFCLDCCTSICPHCLSLHRSHRLLQIRRYVYHDVIRLDDAEKLMDCAFVQAYTTNSAKVVFLNQRPQTRSCRGSGNICYTCDRGLQDQYLFCSISCKIHHLIRTEGGLSRYLFDCECLPLSEPAGRDMFCDLDDDQMTPDSVLDQSTSVRTSSESGGSGGVWCKTLACTATTEIVRKKRSSVPVHRAACRPRPVCLPVTEAAAAAEEAEAEAETRAVMGNRRKRTPHRSPFY
ncbi:protein RGF1 INDUCIBLE TRANSCRIPTION FACTOR 1 isoform X2 [Malania oleifera]|uniref:protein RGF1 INDUCIBLE TRANSCRIPTION FACTOR 1 isoform X2 n=1 Tax=Malania oleifera TaxID=397392 RepID=UPI0025AEA9E9|nr:protein RGF1 INDUCIBLE TRANSCRIPTION FACTOR 1 isoform X2 [Malania oleifera]